MTQVNTNSNSKYLKLLSALIFLCFAYGYLNAQDSTNVFEKIRVLEKRNSSNKLSWDEKNNLVDYYLQAAKETEAAENANKALNMAFAVKSHPAVFKAALTNGDIYFNNRDYTSAIKCYNYCLDALNNEHNNYPKVELPKSKKKNKDEPVSYVAMQESIAKNKYKVNIKLAKCYSLTNETGLELPSLNNALEAAEKNSVDAIAVYEMMVDYNIRQKDYVVAISKQNIVINYYTKISKDIKCAKAYELLGDLYVMKGDKISAEEKYLIPTRFLNKVKDAEMLCSLFTRLRNIQPPKQLIRAYRSEMNKYCGTIKDSIAEEPILLAPPKPATKEQVEAQIEQLKSKKEEQKKELVEAIKKGDTKSIRKINAEQNFRDSLITSLEESQKKIDDLEYEKSMREYEKLKKEKEFAEQKTKTLLEESYRDSLDKVNETKRQSERLQSRIFIGVICIISILLIIYLYNSRKRKELEHQQALAKQKQLTAETEMKALRSQMNPHFIFNALQSIQHFLSKRKSKDASEYLVKFGKLMRMVLEYSRESEVSIQQERDALELYMELESVRQPFKFSFEFDESVSMEDDELPPLILQPFVENAIKHGLKTKKKGGHIKIEGKRINDELIFAVEDNGIGREASKSMQQTTASFKKQSLGMKLTEERLAVLNETKKINAHYRIIDLYDNNNNATGTRVELIIPQTS